MNNLIVSLLIHLWGSESKIEHLGKGNLQADNIVVSYCRCFLQLCGFHSHFSREWLTPRELRENHNHVFLFIKQKWGYHERWWLNCQFWKSIISCPYVHPLLDRRREVKFCPCIHSWRHKYDRQVAYSYGKYLYHGIFFYIFHLL